MRYYLLVIFSLLYRFIRYFLIKFFCFKSYLLKKIFDLEEVIIVGDRVLAYLDRPSFSFAFDFPIPENKGAYLYDLYFPSPLIVSSFKADPHILNIWLRMGMGGIITKTTLELPHLGNFRPRIVDLQKEGAIINAMGLPGNGMEGLVAMLNKHSYLRSWNRPIGLSIGGRNLDEYKRIFYYLEEQCNQWQDTPFFYEFNISCPNVKEGQALSKYLSELNELIKEVRCSTDRVIGIKLSPDQTNDMLRYYADNLAQFSRIYLNLGNTQYKTKASLGLTEDSMKTEGGGLSGEPLFTRTLEMVSLLKSYKVPLIATGGISSIEHVRLLKEQGATLYGVATALIKDPYAVAEINLAL